MKPFVAYFRALFTSLLFACWKKRNDINKWSGLKTNTEKRILFPFHFECVRAVWIGLDWIGLLSFHFSDAADFGRYARNKQIFHFNEKNTKKISTNTDFVTMCILHPYTPRNSFFFHHTQNSCLIKQRSNKRPYTHAIFISLSFTAIVRTHLCK